MSASIDHLHVTSGQRLELYVSPTCPYCKQAFAYYDERHVQYISYDAQNDPVARRRMMAYTGGDPTVPAIVVDGTYVRSGWGDPPRG